MMLSLIVLPLGQPPFREIEALAQQPPAATKQEAPASAGALAFRDAYQRLVETLEAEIRFLRHELEVQAQELRERDGLIETFIPGSTGERASDSGSVLLYARR
jgi:hypothetical protein